MKLPMIGAKQTRISYCTWIDSNDEQPPNLPAIGPDDTMAAKNVIARPLFTGSKKSFKAPPTTESGPEAKI